MKKLTLFVAAVAMMLCACQPSEQQRVATGEPIMPIHVTGYNTTLYLTDYVPTLGIQPKYETTGDYHFVVNQEEETLTLMGESNSIHVLSLGDKDMVDIVILPDLPVKQGLTTVDVIDNKVTISGFGKTLKFIDIESFVQNMRVPEEAYHGAQGMVTIDLNKVKCPAGRSYLRVYAGTQEFLFNDILVPLQDGKPVMDAKDLNRHDVNTQILYSLMIDRFYDGNEANNAPLNRPDVLPQVDYKGGDLKGITKKIEEGFFDQLGISTIWISPITQNPTTPWGQYHNPETRFSGYHGYWPIYNTKLDDRFGTDEELREMLAAAHKHNINVVLDYVANHMHIESPTLQNHPDWVTDSIVEINGKRVRNFELWDEARLTTWFDVHIPSLDLEREEVCDNMTDTALFWVENFDFDGYRHDACKHIPLNYWRMFTKKMKSRLPDRQLWMIGETYGDAELISSYVKTGMLNAQFDFNIYHTAVDVLGKEGQSMQRLADVIDQSCNTYGYHHTMGNISGNHDKCRFISLVGGAVDWNENDKDAGWNRQIGITADGDSAKEARAYKKALLLEVVNLTIPGVPCIYQGDEYGQPGANDPDNRRMMRFEGLNNQEQMFRSKVMELTHLRRNSMPLIYGDYKLQYCDDDILAFTRTYMGETVTVAINKAEQTRTIILGNEQLTIPANDYIVK